MTQDKRPKTNWLKKIWMSIVTGFLKIGNSVIRSGFYIIWSLVLPLTIIFASQGNEMSEFIFYEKNIGHLITVLVGVIFLGYSLWIIPVFFLWIFRLVVKSGRTKYELFNLLNDHRNAENKNTIELRFFAVLPMGIFLVGLLLPAVHEIVINSDPYYLTSISIVIALALILSYLQRLLYPVQKKILLSILKLRPVRVIGGVFLRGLDNFTSLLNRVTTKEDDDESRKQYFPVLIDGMTFNLINWFSKGFFLLLLFLLGNLFFEHRWLLIFYLAFFIIWHYGILQIIDTKSYITNSHFNKHSEKSRIADFIMMNYNYVGLLLVIGVLMIWLYVESTHNNIGYFSPLFIISILFTFFLLLFDIFYKTPKLIIGLLPSGERTKRVRVVRVLLFLLSTGFWLAVVFYNANEHRIRRYVAGAEYINPAQRVSLEEYFTEWMVERDSVKTIFLVSGQGGGSRAAAWTHMCLNAADKYGNLMDNVFALSTASGSSVGVNMKLAQQKLDVPNYFYNETDTVDNIRTLYGKNYFSNSFYGLLWGDLIEGLKNSEPHFSVDRNYRLQKEEVKGFLQTFQIRSAIDSQKVLNHFEKDFLKSYYSASGVLKRDEKLQPLFLINTTRVQDANRVMISPVKMDSSDAIDFYKYFAQSKKNKNFAIPTVTAVGQSQAFPLISSQNFVDDFGNLADGGFVENSGCGAILSVYQKLKKIAPPSIRFVIIDCQNSGDIIHEVYAPKDFDSSENINATLGSLIAVVSETGVSAYSNFWREKLRREIGKDTNDVFVSLGLESDITLARMLTTRSIDAMKENLNRNNNKRNITFIQNLLKPKTTNYER